MVPHDGRWPRFRTIQTHTRLPNPPECLHLLTGKVTHSEQVWQEFIPRWEMANISHNRFILRSQMANISHNRFIPWPQMANVTHNRFIPWWRILGIKFCNPSQPICTFSRKNIKNHKVFWRFLVEICKNYKNSQVFRTKNLHPAHGRISARSMHS